jgi:hypothetical protein
MLVRIDAVARYLIPDRGTVVIEPAPGASPGDVRVFLLGSVLGLLCHLRGLLPLHASCLRIGGRAVALVGHSGEGKSTAAAALVAAGHGILADDITALEISEASALVRPTFPRIKLWPDSLAATNFQGQAESGGRVGQDKYQLHRMDSFSGEPAPLSAIYQLESDPRGGRPDIQPLRGLAAVGAIYPHIYRRRLGEMAVGQEAIFTAVGKLLRHIPYFTLTRRRDLTELDALVGAIEDHVGKAG